MMKNSFSLLLRNERKQRFWSQEELAEKLGTTRVTVSRWEAGITYPNYYYRNKIYEFFNKNPEELDLRKDKEENQSSQLSLTSNRQLPLSYRSELLEKVIASLLAGECCSLVGIGGVGKSSLARFLQRHDVQRHYWGDEAVWVLLIDSQSLIFDEGKADYAVLELIVHHLLDEAEQRGSPPEFLEKAQQLYTQLTDKETTHFAFRVIQDL